MKRKRFIPVAFCIVLLTVVFNYQTVFALSQGQLSTFTALSAEADPHTGSANFAVPIEVPSGRGGIQPNIQLQYNSSSPNGLLGMGWILDLGSVQRSSKSGVPRYDDTDTFVLIQSGGGQELVFDVETGLYHGKVEGAFLRIQKLVDGWEVADKSGVKYFFGENQSSQEYDPADGSRIFRWRLSRVEDLHGNYMTVEYFRDENKLYLQDIYYTGNSQSGLLPFAHVAFERESRPENEISHYSSGFHISMRYRISKIKVSVDGSLQREYDLGYDDSRTTGRSLLTSIIQFGSDGFSSLSPITFSYQIPNNPDFNYDVISVNNPVAGDNLWNHRISGGYDHGSDNYGPCPPTTMCYGVNWGPLSKEGDGNGSLSFSSGQDTAHWFWTYLYVDSARTISPPYTTQGVDGVWLRGDYGNEVHQTWNLQPGYNRVDMTFYNQNQGFNFNLNLDLANYVSLMDSSTVFLSQFSGDFNADGRTDIATFISSSGTVEIELSDGVAFLPKKVWISGFGTNGRLVSGDFNGDGRIDISSFDSSIGNWKVALSDGSRFNDQGAAWMSGFGTGEEPAIGDFNGDGLADILAFYQDSGNQYVRIALNEEGSFLPLSDGQNVLIGSSGDIPLIGDFNGDGQIDFGTFNKAGGNWDIRLNMGSVLAGLEQLPAVSGFGADNNKVLADFNYDGLTDIGYYDNSTGKVVYRVSKGSSFAGAAELPFIFSIRGPNTNIQFGDYNGDTLIDFAVYDLIGALEIAFSNGVMPDILSSVENGLGGRSTIIYDAAVNYPQTFLPFPIRVVKSITKSNGLGESYIIQNSYEQGLWNAQKREFRGFGLVRLMDSDGNYSETTYAQDGIYKGRVTGQRTFDAFGSLYGETVNTWNHEEIAPGSNFIYLKRKDNFVYDGDAIGRRTAEEFFYSEVSQLGNLTKALQFGEVDFVTGTDIPGDSRVIETSYVNSTVSGDWLIGLPNLTVIKNDAGTIVRKVWFYYDGQDNMSAPVKGLLTKKEGWGEGLSDVNPGTQYTYDDYGNLLTTTDPRGNRTAIVYDSVYNIFPVMTTNALGHSVENEYYGVDGVLLESGDGFAGLWGQLKSTTDPNGQIGKRIYDVFGRGVAVVSSLDSVMFPTQTTEIEFLGNYTRVTARQRVEHGKPETIDTVSFIDGFGRVSQTKMRSEVVGRYVISGQAQYNSRGLKNKQYLAAFTTNPMDVVDSIDYTRPHSMIVYDAMGRVVQSTNPDGTFSSVAYNDWTTVAINENGHKQETEFDAYGRLVEKREYLGSDGRSAHYPSGSYTLYATTLYSYDSEGNLIQTQDAHGNITTINYDTLGRKVSMNDPDMGIWKYEYDLNGNLIKQTDAKEQAVFFTYDALNRLIKKTDGANLNVDYTYDDPFVTNSKGRLVQAQYQGGDTQFAYDELGRELQSIKTINAQSYEVGRSYDALNRLVKLQYPGGENIVYRYNPAGQIDAVANDSSLLPAVVLSAPELNLIQAGSEEVKITWASVIDATDYKIKFGEAIGIYTATLDVGDATSNVITGLVNDTTYYFVVSACNEDTESANSNERSATPTAPALITIPAPVVQYVFNDDAANTVVADSGGAYNAATEQTSIYTSDLTGGGTASASSCLLGCGNASYSANKAFDNDYTNWDGWVSNNTRSGWLAYEFSSLNKINRYTIAPRGHIYPNDDGNPRSWTFEGFNGFGWDMLDTRAYSSWVWKSPITFDFENDTAYQKYRLNISNNGGHSEVGLAEMEMMSYAQLYTNTLSSSGKVNKAFNFDGSSQLINADSLLDFRNHTVGSIALWINSSSPSGGDVVFSLADTDGQNRVELLADANLRFNIINSVLGLKISVPNALMAGLWTHVAIVQDRKLIKVYVNGTEAAFMFIEQNLGADAWFNSTWGLDNARIGCLKNNSQGNHNYYGGQLDDFRYYDYSLTAGEIGALYNTGVGTEAFNPQYTEYTPLSKTRFTPDDGLILKSRLVSRVGEIPNVVIARNEAVRQFQSFLSTIGGWIERNVFGVKEVHAATEILTNTIDVRVSSSKDDAEEKPNRIVNIKSNNLVLAGNKGKTQIVAMRFGGVAAQKGALITNAYLQFKADKIDTIPTILEIKGEAAGDAVSFSSRKGDISRRPVTVASGQWNPPAWNLEGEAGSTQRTPDISPIIQEIMDRPDWASGNGLVLIVTGSGNRMAESFDGDSAGAPLLHIEFATAPDAPVLNSPTAGDGQVDLSWDVVSGADGYNLKYGTTSGVYDVTIDVGNAASYTVENLVNDTAYYFAVTAYNAAGESLNSNEVSAEPVAPPLEAPVLSVPFAGDGQVDLTWNSVIGATGYKICYGTVSGIYGTLIDVGGMTSYSVGSLVNDTAYYFVVTAYDAMRESEYSNEEGAMPFANIAEPQLFVKNTDYNAQGQITRIDYGSGTSTTNTYNSLNLRLERIYTVDAQGVIIQDLSYSYDAAGNILSITDAVNTAGQTFQYDELNRLVEATGEIYETKSYAYDEVGNIISKDALWYSYGEGGAGPHAVTSLTDGTTFTFDGNGNMATKQEPDLTLMEYIYDVENRLIEVRKEGLLIAQYEYDGDGGRTKKVTGGITTRFIGSLYEEDTHGRATKFVFLGGARIASITNGATLYYHADHLGGANVLTDNIGEIKELIEYEPFGTYARHDRYGTDEEVSHFYFTDQRKDDETGLYYYGARYYDPQLGKFITADSIVQNPNGNPQTFNRYAYCGNNPVNNIDPSGQSWFSKLIGGILGIATTIFTGGQGGLGLAVFNMVDSTIDTYQNTGNFGLAIGIGVGASIAGGISGGFSDLFFTETIGKHIKSKAIGSFLGELVGASIGAGVSSGISSKSLGGEFSSGFNQGAASGAIFYSSLRLAEMPVNKIKKMLYEHKVRTKGEAGNLVMKAYRGEGNGALGSATTDGHAWVENVNGDRSFGTWPDNHPGNSMFDNHSGVSRVKNLWFNREANMGYQSSVKATMLLSVDQVNGFGSYVSKGLEWSKFNNCSSGAANMWKAAGGGAINNRNMLGIPTVKALADSIGRGYGY